MSKRSIARPGKFSNNPLPDGLRLDFGDNAAMLGKIGMAGQALFFLSRGGSSGLGMARVNIDAKPVHLRQKVM